MQKRFITCLINKNHCRKRKTDIIIIVVKKIAKYYIENKEVLREYAKNRYRDLSEEEKKLKENMEEIDIET